MDLLTATSSVWSANATATEFVPEPNLWVKLRDSLSPYSFDEALLLCQEANELWIAWVPDFGEVVLERHQFYRLTKI
ncbi:MAG: hypothetical protein HC827_04030 [Cyanobacteria bacterium RM1_2_2]|nr:hypothetical protein [Cyanobacteria bacterium RM1_2_2]